MKNNKILFILFSILFSIQGFCQNNTSKLDSLLFSLKIAKEDTNKVNLLVKLGQEIQQKGDLNKSKEYSQKALQLAELLNFKSGIANSYNNLGNIISDQGVQIPIKLTT